MNEREEQEKRQTRRDEHDRQRCRWSCELHYSNTEDSRTTISMTAAYEIVNLL